MAKKSKPQNKPKNDQVLPKPTDLPNASQSSREASPDAPSQHSDTPPHKGFPLVGIGASAGGLSAFEAFFSGLPANSDPGMAFVLVQHLAPDHKSILTDLIRRYTRLQVYEVEDGMVVRPNCAYIIPPGRDMACLGGALSLLEPTAPRGQRLPIDFFFRSLAQDQAERAIGIVLSGTGSDGSLGVRAIKGEGGMVMAQTPDSTEYDGMPRSAIATGVVDYVMPPAEMAAQIMAYVARAGGGTHAPETAPVPPKRESALKKIFILLRAQTGHDFSHYKPNTVNRRIERRMAVQQIETLEAYAAFMQQTPAEVTALFRDLLIGVTSFFRDPDAFKAVQEHIIPKLFVGRAVDSVIRVWSPGCATGEEAYSLAILLAERQEVLKRSFKLQVFATDIDAQAIATARTGVYPASIASDISPERLTRFFTVEPDGGSYRINKSIRDMLVFSEQDVIKDPPFSRLDLISCRNLLIYMDVELQKKLIPLLHYALNPGGFLFLGTSETVSEYGELFSTIDRKLKLYQKKEDLHGAQRENLRFLPPVSAVDVLHDRTAGKSPGPGKLPLRELTEQTLLQQVAPAAALVSATGDILYLHGRTGWFLEPAPGEAGVNNIVKMAREGLRRDLAATLHRAAGTREIVRCSGLRVKTNGSVIDANLTVRPVTTGPSGIHDAPLFLLVLEHMQPEKAAQPETIPADISPTLDADARIAVLQQELRAKEEYLQTTNEELETANEELKSSNEEMQSVNEELQSTNEELETSKEELQSVNEELSTVNAELQTKVGDLTRANNDMNNLLAGTGIATVFVDHSLHILRFTPAATRIINLIQSDIGRPVGHLVSNLAEYDSLTADTQAVLDTLVPIERDVKTRAGIWYAMRILPYRTLENVIEGAVITFVDINSLKKAQEALQQSKQKFSIMFEKAPFAAAIATLPDGTIIDVNESFERTFGYTRQEVIGKTSVELGINRDPELRPRQLAELQQRGSVQHAEMKVRTKSDEERTFLNIFGVIEIENRKHVVTYMQDITELAHVEESLRESEAKEMAALAMLHKLAMLPVHDADLSPILSEIVDVAIAIAGADFGNIQLLDSNSDLRIVVQRGFPQWWLDFWDRAAKGQGACGSALERGERIVVEDVEQSPIFMGTPALEIQLRAGVHAVQSTPLVGRSGIPVGMFSTHYRKPQRPDERKLRLLDLLARQAADIIERARMQEALRESRESEQRSRAAGSGKEAGKKAPVT